MKKNHSRIIYQEGRKWINHRIDGRGPDSSHYLLCHAIRRAARNIKKFGDGYLTVKDEKDSVLFKTTVTRT